MKLAIVYSRAQVGVDAPQVTVEVHISNGLPGFTIVGLPDAAVKESRERVRSAIQNSGFNFPQRRITVNLAPADLPKDGGRFDLAIAIGILASSGQIDADILNLYEFIGELALSGQVRSVTGALTSATAVKKAERKLIIANENANLAALVDGLCVYKANSLANISAFLKGEGDLEQANFKVNKLQENYLDMADVKGQAHAKRALEIAAAGRHHLLFVGPPGTGKTMLASRLPGILPPLSNQEALESAAVHSLTSSEINLSCWYIPKFASPHHTASSIAMVGGGSVPKPGEISRAHHGVLFLDELPEFDRKVLEVLREPLESGQVDIIRASHRASFPASFQLIAAMNPCPCGHLGSQEQSCRCSQLQVKRYLNKLSGPLLERIDLQIEVPRLLQNELKSSQVSENSALIRERVENARNLQLKRQQCPNSGLMPRQIDEFCALGQQESNLLTRAIEKFGLSARVYHRLLKVARTIADLEQSREIKLNHIQESLSYRSLDRRQS
ncbi:YifB family Mg chelatase-like AAA ATPase [Piscirickettsia litoralis]|uniref:ATP-dependent protease n=1 Tax=Piscirickettsia litoralis TaxID=1891921 RepID=A0ABX3A3L3_9GAMM|nr:YifB family Mg chelatase-like AAA ATPase [Piscirickettsia litoralis]ODN43110.1 ATP-dependent protease [Piscirickettsia litoralis]